jgi:hypothetical protein
MKHTLHNLPAGVASWYISKPKLILGKFCSAKELKRLVYSMAIWDFLRTYVIFYGRLVI